MPGIRRVAATAVMAGGLVVMAQLPALAAATGSASLTISASSKIGKLFGYVAVGYRSGVYSIVTISGKVTGAAANDVVRLYAQPFPYKKAAAVVAASAPFGATTATYSLTNRPTVATRYTAKLFASGTATTPLATSAVQTVYALVGGLPPTGIRTCARPTCHEAITLWLYTPASSLKTQMGQAFYPYFAVNLSKTKASPPKYLYLNAGKATVGKTVRVHADEYRVTVTYTFTVGKDAYDWNWLACAKDVEAVDGVGLPGHHGCGAKKISVNVTYLG